MVADALVIVGFGALMVGIGLAFGWAWSLMAGGLLLMMAGARLQQGSK